MNWLKWVRNQLEKTRGKPQIPQYDHGEAERSYSFTWLGIAAGSLASENAAMTYLGKMDKNSPKR